MYIRVYKFTKFRYKIRSDQLANYTANSENAKYYINVSGFLNHTTIPRLNLLGLPIFLSQPHFLNSNSDYADRVKFINQNGMVRKKFPPKIMIQILKKNSSWTDSNPTPRYMIHMSTWHTTRVKPWQAVQLYNSMYMSTLVGWQSTTVTWHKIILRQFFGFPTSPNWPTTRYVFPPKFHIQISNWKI